MQNEPIVFYAKNTNNALPCTISRIPSDQLQVILDYQNQWNERLDHATFKPLLQEEWSFLFSNGFVEGVFHEGKLIYFMGCLYPPLEDNLGLDLELSPELLPHVAHLEIAMCHPNYEGYGIHSTITSRCATLLESDGRTKVICSTVSPINTPSLRALQKAGLKIALEKVKYSGNVRYVMAKYI